MDDQKLELWESLAERRIREAGERGEFDNLPGAGQPLPGLDGSYDPDWWVKEWLRRNSLVDTAAELRRTIRAELPRLQASPASRQTAERVAILNARIEALNRKLPAGSRIDRIAPGDLARTVDRLTP